MKQTMSKLFQITVVALLLIIVGALAGMYFPILDTDEGDFLEFDSDEILSEFGEHYTYHIFTFEQFARHESSSLSEDEFEAFLTQQGYDVVEENPILAEKEFGCSYDSVLQATTCTERVVEEIKPGVVEVFEFTDIEYEEEYDDE